jgi:hypothetical protein
MSVSDLIALINAAGPCVALFVLVILAFVVGHWTAGNGGPR